MGTGVNWYNSSLLAVLPAVAIRGSVLGLVCALFVGSLIVLTNAYRPAWLSQYGTIGLGVLVGFAFLAPLVAAFWVAFVVYSRRRYILTEEGLIEIRGVFEPHKRVIPYDEIEDLTLTRSYLQRRFNVATIRVNALDLEDELHFDGGEMLVRDVKTPGLCYSELRSAVIAHSEQPPSIQPLAAQPAVEDLSSLSGDRLAADTSSEYLMPRNVVHPPKLMPASFGATLAALLGFIAVVLAIPIFVFSGYFTWSRFGVLTVALIVLPAIGGALYTYWRYANTQYEFYGDHVRKVTPNGQQTVQVTEIEGVTAIEEDPPGPETETVGHLALVDDDGDYLLTLEYVPNKDEVTTELRNIIEEA